MAATTGYRATLYLALLLSAIAAALAVLTLRTQTPVDTRTSRSTRDEAALKR